MEGQLCVSMSPLGYWTSAVSGVLILLPSEEQILYLIIMYTGLSRQGLFGQKTQTYLSVFSHKSVTTRYNRRQPLGRVLVFCSLSFYLPLYAYAVYHFMSMSWPVYLIVRASRFAESKLNFNSSSWLTFLSTVSFNTVTNLQYFQSYLFTRSLKKHSYTIEVNNC